MLMAIFVMVVMIIDLQVFVMIMVVIGLVLFIYVLMLMAMMAWSVAASSTPLGFIISIIELLLRTISFYRLRFLYVVEMRIDCNLLSDLLLRSSWRCKCLHPGLLLSRE